MSSSQAYVNVVSPGHFAEWAAASGVSVARLVSASGGGTLSAPEMRDLIAGAKLMSYSIPSGTQNSAVTENANVPHPSVKKVNLALQVDNLY